MAVVASFHLLRFPRRRAMRAMVGTQVDRPALARTPGLRFGRLLGTGRGDRMGLGADLRRWAVFAVWDDDAALDRFLAVSPLAAAWRARSEESYLLRLAPLAAHGSWGGHRLFADVGPGSGGDGTPPADPVGPVAVLTRATVAPRHWMAFHRSVPPVDADLRRSPGLLATAGVGEWPVGLLATFSVWRSADDLEAFAYAQPAHAEVVHRTRSEGWFREELFARFRPYASTGTWDGEDPLRLAGDGNGS